MPWPSGLPPAPLTDPRRLPSHLQPALPIEPRDYYAFWRAPRFRWWKPLLALLLAAFLFAVVTTSASLIGLALDGADLMELARTGRIDVGPGFFLANNVALALCIPIAVLAQWACVQQSPRWLSSLEGGLNWRWLFLVGLAILPLWVALIGVGFFLEPLTDVRWRDYSLLMIVGILVTTPLQAAGEEYLVRGLLGRIVGSWFRAPVVGFVASATVTTWVFMLLHGAGDAWLNAYYAVFGLAAAWMTWRTGGLEAAIALHVVNNLLSEAMLPFIDFSGMFNREDGVADATILVNVGAVVLAVVIVEILARRRPPVRWAAPGRGAWESLAAPAPRYGPATGQTPGAW